MKTLQESLQESLDMYEALRNLKVYTPDCGTSPTICQEWPTKDPYSSDAKGKFDLEKTDWLYTELDGGTGNIATIQWCDDHIYGGISKASNINQLKKEFLKEVGEWIEDNKEYWEEDDYVEMYVELPCGLTYDCSWDVEEEGKEPTAEKCWDKWMSQFNDSYVDGDSSYARTLVDLKAKKVIAGNPVNFDY